MKKIFKNSVFELSIDKLEVAYQESFSVQFKARGEDLEAGTKIAYRIIRESNPNTVKPYDYSISEEYGYIELDDNLEWSKSYINNIHLKSEEDLVFTFSLYYMPEYNVSTLFKSNYQPPTPYPTILDLKPFFTIEPLSPTYEEGQEVSFKITHHNINHFVKIKYSYLNTTEDTREESINTFTTHSDGFVIITLPTVLTDNNSLNFVELWLKDYPQFSAKVSLVKPVENVPINTNPNRTVDIFYPGYYEFSLAPYTKYEAILIGAGGSGGASMHDYKPECVGTKGGNTSLIFNNDSVTASGGGEGGLGFYYKSRTNKEAYQRGISGKPNDNLISNPFYSFTIKENKRGLEGTNTSMNHDGGLPVSTYGIPPFNGGGGKGADKYEVKYLSLAQSNGGPGASGGVLVVTFVNKSSQAEKIEINVGQAGLSYKKNITNPLINEGNDGHGGLLIIKAIGSNE